MSTSMSRTSATIYTFPPRGRFAIREQEMPAAGALPAGVKVSYGSSWYHEEAILAAREAEQGRKN
jgi:Protein of unknown function (DUF2735)